MKNTPTLKALLKLINDEAIQKNDADKEKIDVKKVLLAVLRSYRDELTATNSRVDAELLKKDIMQHFTQQDVDFFTSVTPDAMGKFLDLLNDVPDSVELKGIFKTMMSVLMQVKDSGLLKKSNVLNRFTNAPSYTFAKLEETQLFIDIHLRLAKDYTDQMKSHMRAFQQFKLLASRSQQQAKEEIILERDLPMIARDYAALKLAFSTLDCLIKAKRNNPECTTIINQVYQLSQEIEQKLNNIINHFPAYAKDYMHKLKNDLIEEIKKELPKLIMVKAPASPKLKADAIVDEFAQLNNKICALIGLEAAYSVSEGLDEIRRRESDLAAVYLFDANNLNKPNQTIEQKVNRIKNLETNIQRRMEYIKKPPVVMLRGYALSEIDKNLIADYEDLFADVALAKGKITSQDRVNKAELKEAIKEENKEECKEERKEEISQSAASPASVRIGSMFAKQQPLPLQLDEILQARKTLGRGGKK